MLSTIPGPYKDIVPQLGKWRTEITADIALSSAFTVNIADPVFGGSFDDTADDGLAYIAANAVVAALGGGIIRVPQGLNSYIGSQVTLSDNVSIEGPGIDTAFIYRKSGYTGHLFREQDNCRIYGVTFDGGYRGFVFTVDAATNVLTATGNDFANNDEVRVANHSGTGTLPAPLAVSTPYYIRDKSGSTFKLAATLGGAAIDITTAGTGHNLITHPTGRMGGAGVEVLMTGARPSIENVRFINSFYNAVDASAAYPRIHKCWFDGPGITTEASYAIWAASIGIFRPVITKCEFTHWSVAAIYGGATEMVVDTCTFHANHTQSFPTGGGQIASGDLGHITVKNCHFLEGGGPVTTGIEVDNGRWTIINNTIEDQQNFGVYLQGGSGHVLTNNTVSGSGVLNFFDGIGLSNWEGRGNTPAEMNHENSLGIGTNTPDEALTVAGNANFNGHIAVGPLAEIDMHSGSPAYVGIGFEETYTGPLDTLSRFLGLSSYIVVNASTDMPGTGRELFGMMGILFAEGIKNYEHILGVEGKCGYGGSGSIIDAVGLYADCQYYGSGSVTSILIGSESRVRTTGTATGNVNAIGVIRSTLTIDDPITVTGPVIMIHATTPLITDGTIGTNLYGLRVEDMSAFGAYLVGTGPTNGNAWNIKSFGTNSINLFEGTVEVNNQIIGSRAANGDLTLQGTSHATKTSSYLILQPTGGNVGIGTTTPNAMLDVRGTLQVNLNSGTPPAGLTGTVFQIAGANDTNTRVLFDTFGTANPSFDFRRAAGAMASPTASQSGDNLGQLSWFGYGATAYSSGARAAIRATAAQAWTDSAHGTYLAFFTTPAGSTTSAERVRLTDVGNLKIAGTAVRGTTEGTNHLDIFDGTAPVGTLTNGISIYSASGVPTVMDASGNSNGLGRTSSPTFAGLTLNGSIATSTAIAARVYHNANQAIASGTVTALAFNSERFDTDTIHDTATNNTRLTCKTAGVYQISLTALFDHNTTGWRLFDIRLNGTTTIADNRTPPVTVTGIGTGCTVSVIYQLAVNDYVEAVVLQDSGGSLNILSAAAYSPEFMMCRIA